MSTIDLKDVHFVDEAGCNNNEAYAYGWSKRGTRLHALRPGCKTKRINIIGALNKNQFNAPFIFEGSCNTSVFIIWLQQVLIPTLKPKQYVVLDNATFHKSSLIRAIIEKAGCFLIYLPPYSPDFNPIEHYWYKFKNALRKKLIECEFNIMEAVETLF